MTLNEFGRFLNTKSVGRIEPPINEQMTERVFTAMRKIARDTMPLRWVVDDPANYDVLRRVDANTWIRTPEKPILDSGNQLDIEDELLDALALYVLAGLEVQRGKILMAMYYEELDAYNNKLTETYLAVASNDAERFYAFP